MLSGPVWTIVLAAGRGSRFGGGKQYERVGEHRAVDRVVLVAGQVSDGVVVVLPPGTAWDGPPVQAAVEGGATRAQSVRAGLAAVPADAQTVLVHDAAHPLVTVEHFRGVLAALQGADAAAALPVLPLVEALKQVEGLRVVGHPGRDALVAAQTPHAFRAGALRAAHAGEPEATEDVELVGAAGGTAVVVPGDPRNLHVTTPAELAMAQVLAAAQDRDA